MATTSPKTFGDRLRLTRELRKLTQTELAEHSELTPAAISQLESGDRLPAFKSLTKLANALKTSASYLLGEQGTELPPELQAFFRDLDALDSSDVEKVREYATYLRSRSKSNQKK
jgi:transcriptional regulator with XRE-family HTH domain